MSAGPAVVPLDANEARAFLKAHDLCDGQVAKVTPGRSLRESCLIETRDGAAWFVKRADTALTREDMLYRLLEDGALPAGFAWLVAPRHAAATDDPVRIYTGFGNTPTLSDMLSRPHGYATPTAQRMGALIARMHRCQQGQIPTDPRLPRVRVRSYEAIPVADYAERPGLEYGLFLAKAQGVTAELAALDADLAPRAILHGDLKADNILVGADAIQLVDWELWGVGDAMYDLGTLVGSIVAAWLDHVPSRPNRPVPEWFAAAAVSSARLSGFIEALLAAYETEAGAVSVRQEALLWRSAGVFLLERGHVSNVVYGRFLLATRLAMELGERLLREPAVGTTIFTPHRGLA